ncbi:hypothetical protein GW17_00051646 [Ensete ventricosum]|nr:hypothetical protein GW17_00051646 [Ensete ventricosum]
MNRLGGFGDRDIELEGWLRIAMDGNNWFDKDQVLYERFNGSGLRIGRWVKVAVGGSNRFGKVRVLVQSKGAATIHSYDGDFLRAYPGRTIEPRGMKDKGRSPTSHAEAYYPLYCHPSPYTKKVDKR